MRPSRLAAAGGEFTDSCQGRGRGSGPASGLPTYPQSSAQEYIVTGSAGLFQNFRHDSDDHDSASLPGVEIVDCDQRILRAETDICSPVSFKVIL